MVKTQLTGFSSDLWDLLQTPPTNRDQLGAQAHVKNLSLRPLQIETDGHCTKYKNRGNSALILSEKDWTFVEISFSYQNEYEFTLFIYIFWKDDRCLKLAKNILLSTARKRFEKNFLLRKKTMRKFRSQAARAASEPIFRKCWPLEGTCSLLVDH